MGYEASKNLYEYASGSPIAAVDPSGEYEYGGNDPPFWKHYGDCTNLCTQDKINADNKAYMACLDNLNEIYNGKDGVYTQLRNARDKKIDWWRDWYDNQVRACKRNHKDEPGFEADCELAAYLWLGTMKKNIMLDYWSAIHLAESVERLEVKKCDLQSPCHGKNAGDLR